jgi:hypothetical protein
MMCAGSRLSKRPCQSAYGEEKVAVTVLPSSEASSVSISS